MGVKSALSWFNEISFMKIHERTRKRGRENAKKTAHKKISSCNSKVTIFVAIFAHLF